MDIKSRYCPIAAEEIHERRRTREIAMDCAQSVNIGMVDMGGTLRCEGLALWLVAW